MPVFDEGSTTNTPAHNEEMMPCIAAIADNLSDPGVCWVSLLSSAGRTTLIVEFDADSDFFRRASPDWLSMEPLTDSRLPCNVMYCTVHYILDALSRNFDTPIIWRDRRQERIRCCCFKEK